MSWLRRCFGSLLRVAIANHIQYRGEVMLWATWGIIFPAVSLAMWSAAQPEGESGIGGFQRADFAAYFLLSMIVTHIGAAWDAYEMGHLVRSGAMSPLLLRPHLPMWSSLAENLAYKIVTLGILAPIWLAIGWIVQPHFATTTIDLVAGVAALLLGSAIGYLWGYNVALLAFWTTRTDAIGEFWFGASLLLGGRIAPLGLLPAPLGWLADLLPFKWMYAFPTELLMGRPGAIETIAGLIVQLVWLAGGALVFGLVWPRAVKRYSAVGA